MFPHIFSRRGALWGVECCHILRVQFDACWARQRPAGMLGHSGDILARMKGHVVGDTWKDSCHDLKSGSCTCRLESF